MHMISQLVSSASVTVNFTCTKTHPDTFTIIVPSRCLTQTLQQNVENSWKVTAKLLITLYACNKKWTG